MAATRVFALRMSAVRTSARRHEVAPGLREHVLAVLQIRAQLDRLRSVELPDEHHHAPRARRFHVIRVRLEDLTIRRRGDDGFDGRARRQCRERRPYEVDLELLLVLRELTVTAADARLNDA